MFKDFTEVISFFKNKENKLGMDFGLTRMEKILKALGNPEKEITCIHIAGSNGKGSTLNFLKEIIMAQGLSAGSFTSPHIERLNERIMINNREITDQEILALMNKLVPGLQSSGQEDHVTYFEILTLLSILYFKEQKPDIVLFETGLGGRLDSTNVIHPLLSIITTISLEHTNFLGDTLAKIAFEKAGIIKDKTPVIIGAMAEEASGVIREKAVRSHTSVFALNQDFYIKGIDQVQGKQFFTCVFDDRAWSDLEIGMLGEHQVQNASLALAACFLLARKGVLAVNEKSVREGLKRASWKGRIEVISSDPLVILDGAHNPDGMKVLIKTLTETYPNKKFKFVMAILKDKDYIQMLSIVNNTAEELVFTEIQMERSLTAKELFEKSLDINKMHFKDWKQALEYTLEGLKAEEALVVTGSLYFIAETRGYLINKFKS